MSKTICESCPFLKRDKRRMGHGLDPEEVHRVAGGGWRACDEDGGTCNGAVVFARSDEAASYQVPPEAPVPAVARKNGPEATPAPEPRPAPTHLDFVSTDKEA